MLFRSEEDLLTAEDFGATDDPFTFELFDEDAEVDANVECFDIVGAVDTVLADCADCREDTEEDRSLLLRLVILRRPLLPRVLDFLPSFPSFFRVADLRVVPEREAVLGVAGCASLNGAPSRGSLFCSCSVGLWSMPQTASLSSSSLPSTPTPARS